eukprot:m.19258 g.19258  ORF g.19258 m.19258 type:complete len:519 (-) comp6524_c0_seq1:115-1671(-)
MSLTVQTVPASTTTTVKQTQAKKSAEASTTNKGTVSGPQSELKFPEAGRISATPDNAEHAFKSGTQKVLSWPSNVNGITPEPGPSNQSKAPVSSSRKRKSSEWLASSRPSKQGHPYSPPEKTTRVQTQHDLLQPSSLNTLIHAAQNQQRLDSSTSQPAALDPSQHQKYKTYLSSNGSGIPSKKMQAARKNGQQQQTSSNPPSSRASKTLKTTSAPATANKGRRPGKCVCCKTEETPLWRKGRQGKMLCNACGKRWLRYGVACSSCDYVPRKHETGLFHCPHCRGQLLQMDRSRRTSNGQSTPVNFNRQQNYTATTNMMLNGGIFNSSNDTSYAGQMVPNAKIPYNPAGGYMVPNAMGSNSSTPMASPHTFHPPPSANGSADARSNTSSPITVNGPQFPVNQQFQWCYLSGADGQVYMAPVLQTPTGLSLGQIFPMPNPVEHVPVRGAADASHVNNLKTIVMNISGAQRNTPINTFNVPPGLNDMATFPRATVSAPASCSFTNSTKTTTPRNKQPKKRT